MNQNKETMAGAILLFGWIFIMLLIGGKIQPDFRGGGGYEPTRVVGHPLYQDF